MTKRTNAKAATAKLMRALPHVTALHTRNGDEPTETQLQRHWNRVDAIEECAALVVKTIGEMDLEGAFDDPSVRAMLDRALALTLLEFGKAAAIMADDAEERS